MNPGHFLQIICFLLLSVQIFAQPQLLRQTRQEWDADQMDWVNHDRTFYDYDIQDNKTLTYSQAWNIEKERWASLSKKIANFNSSGQQTFFSWQQWNTKADTLRSHSQTHYIFDAAGNNTEIIAQRWNFFQKAFVDRWVILQKYDENGCLIEKTNLQNSGLGLGNTIRTFYDRDENCRTFEILEQHWENASNEWRDSELTEYYYSSDLDSTIRTFSWNHPDSNRFVILGQSQTLFDQQGRWIGSWTNVSDFSKEERRSRSYASDGRIRTETYEVLFDHLLDWVIVEKEENEFDHEGLLSQKTVYKDWSPSSEIWKNSITTSYFYDDQGFLIREHILDTWHTIGESTEAEILYTNYCDGLPKIAQRNWLNSGVFTPKYKTHYIYTEGAPCEPTFNEDELVLYPNPTSGLLLVQHPMFRRGDTKVEIFDAAGRLAVSPFISYRAEIHEMDLSGLPEGTYYIRFTNGALSVGKRVMVIGH